LHQRHLSKHYIIWAFLFCFLYAASDEWHQSFVSNRTPEILDWAADVVGIIIGGSVYLLYREVRGRLGL